MGTSITLLSKTLSDYRKFVEEKGFEFVSVDGINTWMCHDASGEDSFCVTAKSLQECISEAYKHVTTPVPVSAE